MTDANETAKEEAIKIPDVLPVLPLKDLVIFPFIIVPLSVSREKSINAVDQALAENRVIMLTAQKDFQNEDPPHRRDSDERALAGNRGSGSRGQAEPRPRRQPGEEHFAGSDGHRRESGRSG